MSYNYFFKSIAAFVCQAFFLTSIGLEPALALAPTDQTQDRSFQRAYALKAVGDGIYQLAQQGVTDLAELRRRLLPLHAGSGEDRPLHPTYLEQFNQIESVSVQGDGVLLARQNGLSTIQITPNGYFEIDPGSHQARPVETGYDEFNEFNRRGGAPLAGDGVETTAQRKGKPQSFEETRSPGLAKRFLNDTVLPHLKRTSLRIRRLPTAHAPLPTAISRALALSMWFSGLDLGIPGELNKIEGADPSRLLGWEIHRFLNNASDLLKAEKWVWVTPEDEVDHFFSRKQNVLVFPNHAGGFAVDLILLSELVRAGHQVTLALEGSPAGLAMQAEEARSWLSENAQTLDRNLALPEDTVFSVVQSGVGTTFQEAWNEATVIVAMGVRNFQSLSRKKVQKPVLYLVRERTRINPSTAEEGGEAAKGYIRLAPSGEDPRSQSARHFASKIRELNPEQMIAKALAPYRGNDPAKALRLAEQEVTHRKAAFYDKGPEGVVFYPELGFSKNRKMLVLPDELVGRVRVKREVVGGDPRLILFNPDNVSQQVIFEDQGAKALMRVNIPGESSAERPLEWNRQILTRYTEFVDFRDRVLGVPGRGSDRRELLARWIRDIGILPRTLDVTYVHFSGKRLILPDYYAGRGEGKVTITRSQGKSDFASELLLISETENLENYLVLRAVGDEMFVVGEGDEGGDVRLVAGGELQNTIMLRGYEPFDRFDEILETGYYTVPLWWEGDPQRTLATDVNIRVTNGEPTFLARPGHEPRGPLRIGKRYEIRGPDRAAKLTAVTRVGPEEFVVEGFGDENGPIPISARILHMNRLIHGLPDLASQGLKEAFEVPLETLAERHGWRNQPARYIYRASERRVVRVEAAGDGLSGAPGGFMRAARFAALTLAAGFALNTGAVLYAQPFSPGSPLQRAFELNTQSLLREGAEKREERPSTVSEATTRTIELREDGKALVVRYTGPPPAGMSLERFEREMKEREVELFSYDTVTSSTWQAARLKRTTTVIDRADSEVMGLLREHGITVSPEVSFELKPFVLDPAIPTAWYDPKTKTLHALVAVPWETDSLKEARMTGEDPRSHYVFYTPPALGHHILLKAWDTVQSAQVRKIRREMWTFFGVMSLIILAVLSPVIVSAAKSGVERLRSGRPDDSDRSGGSQGDGLIGHIRAPLAAAALAVMALMAGRAPAQGPTVPIIPAGEERVEEVLEDAGMEPSPEWIEYKNQELARLKQEEEERERKIQAEIARGERWETEYAPLYKERTIGYSELAEEDSGVWKGWNMEWGRQRIEEALNLLEDVMPDVRHQISRLGIKIVPKIDTSNEALDGSIYTSTYDHRTRTFEIVVAYANWPDPAQPEERAKWEAARRMIQEEDREPFPHYVYREAPIAVTTIAHELEHVKTRDDAERGIRARTAGRIPSWFWNRYANARLELKMNDILMEDEHHARLTGEKVAQALYEKGLGPRPETDSFKPYHDSYLQDRSRERVSLYAQYFIQPAALLLFVITLPIAVWLAYRHRGRIKGWYLREISDTGNLAGDRVLREFFNFVLEMRYAGPKALDADDSRAAFRTFFDETIEKNGLDVQALAALYRRTVYLHLKALDQGHERQALIMGLASEVLAEISPMRFGRDSRYTALDRSVLQLGWRFYPLVHDLKELKSALIYLRGSQDEDSESGRGVYDVALHEYSSFRKLLEGHVKSLEREYHRMAGPHEVSTQLISDIFYGTLARISFLVGRDDPDSYEEAIQVVSYIGGILTALTALGPGQLVFDQELKMIQLAETMQKINPSIKLPEHRAAGDGVAGDDWLNSPVYDQPFLFMRYVPLDEVESRVSSHLKPAFAILSQVEKGLAQNDADSTEALKRRHYERLVRLLKGEDFWFKPTEDEIEAIGELLLLESVHAGQAGNPLHKFVCLGAERALENAFEEARPQKAAGDGVEVGAYETIRALIPLVMYTAAELKRVEAAVRKLRSVNGQGLEAEEGAEQAYHQVFRELVNQVADLEDGIRENVRIPSPDLGAQLIRGLFRDRLTIIHVLVTHFPEKAAAVAERNHLSESYVKNKIYDRALQSLNDTKMRIHLLGRAHPSDIVIDTKLNMVILDRTLRNIESRVQVEETQGDGVDGAGLRTATADEARRVHEVLSEIGSQVVPLFDQVPVDVVSDPGSPLQYVGALEKILEATDRVSKNARAGDALPKGLGESLVVNLVKDRVIAAMERDRGTSDNRELYREVQALKGAIEYLSTLGQEHIILFGSGRKVDVAATLRSYVTPAVRPADTASGDGLKETVEGILMQPADINELLTVAASPEIQLPHLGLVRVELLGQGDGITGQVNASTIQIAYSDWADDHAGGAVDLVKLESKVKELGFPLHIFLPSPSIHSWTGELASSVRVVTQRILEQLDRFIDRFPASDQLRETLRKVLSSYA